MKKTVIQFISLASLVCCSFLANADKGTDTDADDQFKNGEKMHNEHCYKCHTEKVYTRDDRFVKSLNALSKQVVRCKDNTGAPWFDEDTDAVVHFLNEKYYKF
jgi:mono/diheme cytochrome c family protein